MKRQLLTILVLLGCFLALFLLRPSLSICAKPQPWWPDDFWKLNRHLIEEEIRELCLEKYKGMVALYEWCDYQGKLAKHCYTPSSGGGATPGGATGLLYYSETKLVTAQNEPEVKEALRVYLDAKSKNSLQTQYRDLLYTTVENVKLKITPEWGSPTIQFGDSIKFRARVYFIANRQKPHPWPVQRPDDYPVDGYVEYYSSDENGLEADSDGFCRAHHEGSYTVEATLRMSPELREKIQIGRNISASELQKLDGAHAKYTVSVKPPMLKEVILKPDYRSLNAGEKFTFEDVIINFDQGWYGRAKPKYLDDVAKGLTWSDNVKVTVKGGKYTAEYTATKKPTKSSLKISCTSHPDLDSFGYILNVKLCETAEFRAYMAFEHIKDRITATYKGYTGEAIVRIMPPVEPANVTDSVSWSTVKPSFQVLTEVEVKAWDESSKLTSNILRISPPRPTIDRFELKSTDVMLDVGEWIILEAWAHYKEECIKPTMSRDLTWELTKGGDGLYWNEGGGCKALEPGSYEMTGYGVGKNYEVSITVPRPHPLPDGDEDATSSAGGSFEPVGELSSLGEDTTPQTPEFPEPEAPPAPICQSIVIFPDNIVVEPNQEVTFTATASFSDDTKEDVTIRATWEPGPRNTYMAPSDLKFKESITIKAKLDGCLGYATVTATPYAYSPPISHYDDDWTKPTPKPPPDAYTWFVLCDKKVDIGAVVYGKDPDPTRYSIIQGPFPGPRTAVSWIEKNCPSGRCDTYGRCATEPPPAPIGVEGHYVLCNKGSGAITVSKHFSSSTDVQVMAGPLLGEPAARMWISQNCPSERCNSRGTCAKKPARGGKWAVVCSKTNGEVTLTEYRDPTRHWILDKGFLGEPDARRWVEQNCSSWRCDKYGKCLPGKPYKDTTSAGKPPFDSSYSDFLSAHNTRENQRNEEIWTREAYDQSLAYSGDQGSAAETVDTLLDTVHPDIEKHPEGHTHTGGGRTGGIGETAGTGGTNQYEGTAKDVTPPADKPPSQQPQVNCITLYNSCNENCSRIRQDCIDKIHSPIGCKSCMSITCKDTYAGYWCDLHPEWVRCINPVFQNYLKKLEKCNRDLISTDPKDENRGPNYGKCLETAHNLMKDGWSDCYKRACDAHCAESGKRGQIILRPVRCECE